MFLKKLIFFIAALVLLPLFVSAISFDIEVKAIKYQIIVNETAEFDITISNNLASEEEFIFHRIGYPFWDMFVKPLISPITYVIPANSKKTFRIFVKPLYITTTDTFTLEATIENSRTGIKAAVPMTIGVKSTDNLVKGYVPNVMALVSIPKKIDPREEFKISIELRNQNPVDYEDLTVIIESNIVKETIFESLKATTAGTTIQDPGSVKTIDLIKKIDSMTNPTKDSLSVSVVYDGRVIVNPIVKNFEIIEYFSKEEELLQKGFLKIRKKLTFTSNNQQYKGEIRSETKWFDNLFTSTEPKSKTVKEDGKLFLVWDVKLSQDKSMTITITENYRPLVVIIVFAIIIIVLYYVFRSPLTVRKTVTNIVKSEGGVSGFKVVLKIKNRGKKELKDIEVGDLVPRIVMIEKEISIGTLQPYKIINNEKKGMIIKWKLESLENNEERVLSYKIKSRLSILGSFTIPSATARFKHNKSIIITNSNRVLVSS